MARPPVPVTVLSGFLGAGKTSTLTHILTHAHTFRMPPRIGAADGDTAAATRADGSSGRAGVRIGVIVNDMSEINVDATTIARVHTNTHTSTDGTQEERPMIELHNGCICCTKRDDLLHALQQMAGDDALGLDLIVVESSGISEPLPVAEVFTFSDADERGRTIADVARLDTTVTLVDAYNFHRDWDSAERLHDREWAAGEGDERNVVDLLVDQIEFADVIVLNKVDLVSPEILARTRAIIKQLNPDARVVESSHGRVPLDALLNTGSFSLEKASTAPGWLKELRGTHVPETVEYGIRSFVFRARRPFHPTRLYSLVEGTTPTESALPRADALPVEHVAAMKTVIRSKGLFWLAADGGFDDSCLWAHAGRIFEFTVGREWWATTPREEWDLSPAMEAAVMREWDPKWGDRRQEIVVIGVGMDPAAVNRALEWALLNDTELEAGPTEWAKYADPFDVIMEQVDTDEEAEDDEDEVGDDSGKRKPESAEHHVHGPGCSHASHNVIPKNAGRFLISAGGVACRAADAGDEEGDYHDEESAAPFVRRVVRPE